MIQVFTQKLVKARALLQNKKHTEACDLLRELDVSDLSEGSLSEYYLLYAEALIELGDYSFDYVDKAIESFRFSSNTANFSYAKYLKGRALSASGNHFDARESFLEAYAGYKRLADRKMEAYILNSMAYSLTIIGNIYGAIENLQKCTEIYTALDDKGRLIKVTHNLAKTYQLTGQLRRASECYTNSPFPSTATADKKGHLLYYAMSAVPHALLGDTETALRVIKKAEPYIEEYPREKAVYCENSGLINILAGNYDIAENLLRAGLDISLEIAPESALVSQINRLLGDLNISTARFELAHKYASEALEVAVKIDERVEIAACYRIFAQVMIHKGKVAQAKEWFEKAIELFSQISSYYQLAVTRYLAAVSGAFVKSEQTAMLYLARDYFYKEKISHFTEKIDTATEAAVPIRSASVSKSIGETSCPTIITSDPDMKRLLDLAEHIAPSKMNVLITGETGTGKDILARYIHCHSGRSGEFVSVNTAAIPNEMIEAELFGHVKGAFTGAGGSRKGLIVEADKGTLYLNEIADASPALQAKLLEVLESREVRRLGENGSNKVDFRLIAATNSDLRQKTKENQFRLDLYHRLNEIKIELPPLSDRGNDIEQLLKHFLKITGYTFENEDRSVLSALENSLAVRNWPGNIRQLKAEISRLWILSHGNLKTMHRLLSQTDSLSEKEHLLKILERTGWNRSKTAAILGVSEGTIRYRIRKFNLENAVS